VLGQLVEKVINLWGRRMSKTGIWYLVFGICIPQKIMVSSTHILSRGNSFDGGFFDE